MPRWSQFTLRSTKKPEYPLPGGRFIRRLETGRSFCVTFSVKEEPSIARKQTEGKFCLNWNSSTFLCAQMSLGMDVSTRQRLTLFFELVARFGRPYRSELTVFIGDFLRATTEQLFLWLVNRLGQWLRKTHAILVRITIVILFNWWPQFTSGSYDTDDKAYAYSVPERGGKKLEISIPYYRNSGLGGKYFSWAIKMVNYWIMDQKRRIGNSLEWRISYQGSPKAPKEDCWESSWIPKILG